CVDADSADFVLYWGSAVRGAIPEGFFVCSPPAVGEQDLELGEHGVTYRSAQAKHEVDLVCPLRVIDQRVAVPLHCEDRVVSVTLQFVGGMRLVPANQNRHPIFSVLVRCGVYLAGVTEQEVKRGASNRPLAVSGLELVTLSLAALLPDRFLEVG